MELVSLIFGLYPRTQDLRRAYNKWEKGILSTEEVGEKIETETIKFYELANSAQLNYYTDPLFNWFDIFRPFVLSVGGINLGPLTRYKETNTFYRLPIIERIGPLNDIAQYREMKENPPLPLYHNDGSDSYVYFLPGIHSLLRMSKVNANEDDVEKSLRKIYVKMINELKIKKLLIFEPLEVNNFGLYEELNEITKIFLVITGKVDNSHFAGNGKKFYSVIGDDPYSYDNHCEIPGIKLIDSMNTKVENNVVERLKRFANDFDKMIVTNNESFDFLPRSIADKKIFNFKGGE